MAVFFFNPFQNYLFEPKICFLTGEEVTPSEDTISVFPDWIMDKFELRDKKFRMMDQVTQIVYEQLKLPCSKRVKNAFDKLDDELKKAFGEGFKSVQQLSEQKLFLWMGRIVYGLLYHDIQIETERLQRRDGKKFTLSALLKERYSLFHLMLQSIVSPVEFSPLKPWSISIVQLKYSKEIFHYRDNPVNLVFSLGMNGFGIMANLQDNGAVKENQKNILKKTEGVILHPVQFEELCARMLYANYLLQQKPTYDIQPAGEGIFITASAMNVEANKPLFGKWDDTMFAQVLAGYLEAWGYTTQNITRFPEGPISFLEEDYSDKLIDPETIALPY